MRRMSLLSPIHHHYAWPDPISLDGTFKKDDVKVDNQCGPRYRYRIINKEEVRTVHFPR
jgi:hypothetical protein